MPTHDLKKPGLPYFNFFPQPVDLRTQAPINYKNNEYLKKLKIANPL
jgi:hypothetical protein